MPTLVYELKPVGHTASAAPTQPFSVQLLEVMLSGGKVIQSTLTIDGQRRGLYNGEVRVYDEVRFTPYGFSHVLRPDGTLFRRVRDLTPEETQGLGEIRRPDSPLFGDAKLLEQILADAYEPVEPERFSNN